jgi:uncharacterized membrane protein
MWMWGTAPWGAWWIFPGLGFLMCLVFMIMAFRVMTTGHGVMCMGRHQHRGRDEATELRRELQELREEIAQHKASR